MSLPISLLSIDKTGNNSSNLIQNEIQELPYGMMVIKPAFYAYYTSSLVLIAIDDDNNQHTLVRSSDFKCTDILPELTANTGKEICGSILLLPHINYTKFKLQYQAYGGTSNPSIRNIYQSIDNLFTEGLVDYANITNRPKRFNPTPHHLHEWIDLYGLEYLVDQVNLISEAITNSPNLLELDIGIEINKLFNAYYRINLITIDNNHLTTKLNPHLVDKTEIGLANVNNLEMITNYISTSLTDDFLNDNRLRYVSNYSASNFITSFGNLNKAKYIGSSSTYATDINNISALTTTNANTAINNMNLTVNQNGSTYILNKLNTLEPIVNTSLNNANSFRNKNYNKEISIILDGILNHKFHLDGTVLNIPSKIDNLVSWIDFNDNGVIIADGSGYISSITDKATSRTFTNSGVGQPRLITISNNVNNSINKNKIAKFTTNGKLVLASGDPIILGKEFTLIALVNTSSGEGILMHSSVTNNKVWINSDIRKGIKIDNMLNAKDNTSNDNLSLLNILAVKDGSINSYYANNYSNNTFNNLNTFTITNSLGFDTIGTNTTNIVQELHIAEILIYNRKLATCEINSICKYLNKKWANTNNQFSVDINYIEQQL